MADFIQLRGLRVTGRHGVLEHERQSAQPFQIDLDIEVDLRPSGASDDLDETIDYGTVVHRVEAIVRNESHLLIERVAARIADDVLEDSRAIAVDVTLTKLRPPVPADLATASVRIHRP